MSSCTGLSKLETIFLYINLGIENMKSATL